MATTVNDRHVKIKNLTINGDDQQIDIIYPVNTSDDVVISSLSEDNKIPEGVNKLTDILNKLGNLAFIDSVSSVDSATSSNIGNAIVKRDADGNFSAGVITANLNGSATKASQDITGQKIDTTYIKEVTISGKTVTITKGDGTETTQTTQDTTYQDATQSTHGLLSITDKIKLDSVESGANKTVVDDSFVENSINPVQSKVVKTELDKKAPIVSPAFTGTPTAPTAADGTNNTQIATTEFVQKAVNVGIAANDAMVMKGTIGTTGKVQSLPTTYNIGWTYRVVTAGTYAGQVCEVGDLIVAVEKREGSGNLDSDWCVAQTNIDGAITEIKTTDATKLVITQSADTVTIDHGTVNREDTSSSADAVYGGAFTVLKNITTDTTGHITGAEAVTITMPAQYTHPAYNEKTSDFYVFSVDNTGHVNSTRKVTKEDITALGIPEKNYESKTVIGENESSITDTTTILDNGNVYINHVENGQVKSSHKISGSGATTVKTDANGNIIITSNDTTYNEATETAAGLMSSSDKVKLNGLTAIKIGSVNPGVSCLWFDTSLE